MNDYSAVVIYNGSEYCYHDTRNALQLVERLRKQGFLFEKHTYMSESGDFHVFRQVHYIAPERWFGPSHYVKQIENKEV